MSSRITDLSDHRSLNKRIAPLSSETNFRQPQPKGGISLRLKAMLFAISITALPLLGVGTVAYFVGQRFSQEATEKLEQRLASELQTQLTQLMAERAGDVQIMAGLAIFAEADSRQTTAIAEKNKVLNQFLKAYPLYDSIAAFDLDGELLAQTQGKPLGNHRDRSYFQAAIQTQKVVFSQPTISTSSGVFSVYVATPIKDSATGQLVGVVRARVPIENLVKLTSAAKNPGSTYYLINAAGELFYGSKGQIVNTVNSSGAQVAPKAGPDATAQSQSRQIETIFPEITKLRSAQTAGSLIANNQAEKVEQLVTYIPPLPSTGLLNLKWEVPDLNWSVVLATNTAEALAAQRAQLLLLLIGAGVTTAAVSVLAIYLVNRVMRPILESAQTVEKLGQGELNTRVQVHGKDELAMLGSNINRMADQIQGLLQTLSQNAAQSQQYNQALFQLAQNEALVQGNAQAAASQFTAAIAQVLQTERVGIWLYPADRAGLTCFDQYDLSTDHHSEAAALLAADWPDYFQSLLADPFMAIADVQSDAAMQAFAASCLAPDTRSLLSVPIQSGARTIGIIRCDQVHHCRTWQPEEQTFLASIANLVAIVLESNLQQQEVNQMLDAVCDAEEGDLTTQAQVSDRTIGLVADTFNRLIERFAQILHQVFAAAQQVSAGATQQKDLVATVTQNAQQQAQAVAQVLQITEQVEQRAQVSAQTVQASSESLQVTADTVAQGQAVIEALTQEIAVLQTGSDRIMQRMKTLGEFVGMADQFVQDQSQIAFVTQTLALNASLVAARASEQRDPRQFVVVAREFDAIAEQVSKLAKQTNEGLGSIEQRSAQIHKVVSAVDADVQGLGSLVRRFTQGVEQSQQVFNQVQTVMATAVQVGDTVAVSSQDIVAATRSTATAMREIATLAATNTHLTQQTQAQFEQMDALSKHLLQSIQFFQLPTISESDRPQAATLAQTAVPASDADLSLPLAPVAMTPDLNAAPAIAAQGMPQTLPASSPIAASLPAAMATNHLAPSLDSLVTEMTAEPLAAEPIPAKRVLQAESV